MDFLNVAEATVFNEPDKCSVDSKLGSLYKQGNSSDSFGNPPDLIQLLNSQFPVPFKGADDPLEPVTCLLDTVFRFRPIADQQILIGLKSQVLKIDHLFRSVSVVYKYFFFVQDGAALHALVFDTADLIPITGLSLQSKKTLAGYNGTLDENMPGHLGLPRESRPALPGMGKKRDTKKSGSGQLSLELTCKVCMDNSVDTTFIPCGHFATCSSCSAALRDCPVCRKKIEGTVGTFI